MSPFDDFSLSAQDITLLWTCPIISTLGSLVRGWVSEINLLKPPVYNTIPKNDVETKVKQTCESKRERGYWVTGMCLAGSCIGLGIALLFLGAIQPAASAVGRLWFLSLVLGYCAPIVVRNIDKKVENILSK